MEKDIPQVSPEINENKKQNFAKRILDRLSAKTTDIIRDPATNEILSYRHGKVLYKRDNIDSAWGKFLPDQNRAVYSFSDFETGWYFKETLHPGDILRNDNLLPLPPMHEYLKALDSGVERARQQAIYDEEYPEEAAVRQAEERARFDAIPPMDWLPLR